jgi:hypothetical protein
MDSFFKVDDLLARCEEEPLLIFDFEFNQTNAVGSMGHLCSRFKEVARFARGQEVDIVLEGNGWFSKAVSSCFTGLIGY